jgi:hypothetical protein
MAPITREAVPNLLSWGILMGGKDRKPATD